MGNVSTGGGVAYSPGDGILSAAAPLEVVSGVLTAEYNVADGIAQLNSSGQLEAALISAPQITELQGQTVVPTAGQIYELSDGEVNSGGISSVVFGIAGAATYVDQAAAVVASQTCIRLPGINAVFLDSPTIYMPVGGGVQFNDIFAIGSDGAGNGTIYGNSTTFIGGVYDGAITVNGSNDVSGFDFIVNSSWANFSHIAVSGITTPTSLGVTANSPFVGLAVNQLTGAAVLINETRPVSFGVVSVPTASTSNTVLWQSAYEIQPNQLSGGTYFEFDFAGVFGSSATITETLTFSVTTSSQTVGSAFSGTKVDLFSKGSIAPATTGAWHLDITVDLTSTTALRPSGDLITSTSTVGVATPIPPIDGTVTATQTYYFVLLGQDSATGGNMTLKRAEMTQTP